MNAADIAAADRRLLERFTQRAQLPPRQVRLPLRTADGEHTIGSIEDELGSLLADEGLLVSRVVPGEGWRLPAGVEPDPALATIARWLRSNGLGGRWRDELLQVDDMHGVTVASIERAAVRPLGIATHAVHLVGHRADGTVWVQQRALDKATDPGLWDTLMGGLVAAGESIVGTLERETWEEAGLRIEALEATRPFGRLSVRRPVGDGYMVEHIAMFEARVPETLVPQNQDGEVAQFARLTLDDLREGLNADQFTLEAALILAHWLQQAR